MTLLDNIHNVFDGGAHGFVLLGVTGEKQFPAQVGRRLGQRPQLQQVHKVQILQPIGSFAFRRLRTEASHKLVRVAAPYAVRIAAGHKTLRLGHQIVGAEVNVDARMDAGQQPIEGALLHAQVRYRLGHFVDVAEQRILLGLVDEAILQINAAPNAMRRRSTVAGELFGVQQQVNVFGAILMVVQNAEIVLLLVEVGPDLEAVHRLLRQRLVQVAQLDVVIAVGQQLFLFRQVLKAGINKNTRTHSIEAVE